jgi:hypothetical protein
VAVVECQDTHTTKVIMLAAALEALVAAGRVLL